LKLLTGDTIFAQRPLLEGTVEKYKLNEFLEVL